MSTMIFYIDFKGEFGEIDVAPYCLPDLSYTDVYHNTSFKAIKNIMKINLSDPNGELIEAFFTYSGNFLPCRLYINDDLKFRGYIRNNFSTKLSHNYETITLEAIDISKGLETNLPDSIELENADICDTANPENSIIHQLLYRAGWGSSYYYGYAEEYIYGFSEEDLYSYINISLDTLIDVPITIDYYFKSRFGDHTIYELVQELLEEAGYCLVVSPDGYPYIDTIISRGAGETDVTLVDKKVFKGFTVNRKSVEYDSVKGKWYEHEFLEEQLVFDEETDGTEEYDCFVPIGDDESYPEGSHEMIGGEYSNVTKLNFDVEDRELIVAKYVNSQVKATLAFNQEGIDWEWAKLRTEDYWYGDSIDQGVHNLYTPSGSTEQILLHLSVVADVIVKGDMHQEIASVSDLSVKKELEKEFKYITDKTTVETVVQGLLDNYVFGKYTYEFETKEEFLLGGYYQVTEPVYSNTEHPIKITKKESIYKWTKNQGYHLYKYKYTGVSYGAVPYIETTSSRFTSRKPTTPKRKWTEKLQEDFEIDNPYPPYSVGETWEKEDGLYICVTSKAGSESYSEDDWEIYKRTKAGKNAVGYTIYPDGADEDKNKIDIHAVTPYGEPLTEEMGWMFDGDVKIQIPITIGLAVPVGRSYLFADTASGEIVTVVYDLATDMRLEYTSDGSAIGAGRFIGEVICEDVSGVDTITGVLMFERVKNTAELKEYHKTKVLTAMGEPGVNFAAAADEMGIKNFLTSLAVYDLFAQAITANNLKVTNGSFEFRAGTFEVGGIPTKVIDVIADGITIFKIDPISKDIFIGNYDGGNGAAWDHSEGEFKIAGTVTAGTGSSMSYGDVSGGPPADADETKEFLESENPAFRTQSGKFEVFNNGKIKAVDAELIGRLRTGLDAPQNARINARDEVGILDGPNFTGSGLNDLDIIEEGDVAGNFKIEITDVNSNTLDAIGNGAFVSKDLDSNTYAVAVNSSGRVIIGGPNGKISYSDDYQNWSHVTIGDGAFDYWLKAICTSSDRFYLVGHKAYMAYSDDGMNWNIITPPADESNLNTITVSSSGNFVAAGNNVVAYSSDGINWTYDYINMQAEGIAVNSSGRFVIVGGDRHAYSDDGGVTWTQDNVDDLTRFEDVKCLSSGKFITAARAVSGSIRIYTSNDGANWDDNIMEDHTYTVSVLSTGRIVLGSSNGFFYSDDDGATWTYVSYEVTEITWMDEAVGPNDRYFLVAWKYPNSFLVYTKLTDIFKWSPDNGSSWNIDNAIPFNGSYILDDGTDYGITISFGSTEGHTIGDYWTFEQGDTRGLTIEDSSGSEYFSAYNRKLFFDQREMFACRAWVNINGDTSSKRKSGNVSSIDDYVTGSWRISFLENLPDNEYSVVGNSNYNNTGAVTDSNVNFRLLQTSEFIVDVGNEMNDPHSDPYAIYVAVFR